MAHDIIGDIHGQSGKLESLLKNMGYRHQGGAWRHPDRTAVFVGDFVDRGPGQLDTLNLVRAMRDAGTALVAMGNHEFNAIALHMPDPERPGHLRIRNEKNRRQHQRFLDEVGEDSPLHAEWVAWFKTLPLWLELPGFRVVHACWHPDSMAMLAGRLGPEQTVTDALMVAASRTGTPEFQAVEAIVKGLEISLPDPLSYRDAEGHVRRQVRVRWWDETANTYRQAAIIDRATRDLLPESPLPLSARVSYDGLKPVFFGHYWMTGGPALLSPQMCCVDYSAARQGESLVAYRWDGEQTLENGNFVSAG